MNDRTNEPGVIRQASGSSSGLNLGGIGTGGVELWPDGRFHHWNIVNCRPWASMQKESHRKGTPHHAIDPVQASEGDTDFFVRVQRQGERPQYRWLFTDHGDMLAIGHFFRQHKYFFIKAFKAIDYRAEYPFIRLAYLDDEFPVEVRLCAWTPFVPRDVKNSSLPGFYLDFELRNRRREPVDVSVVWQQQNFAGHAAPQAAQRHSLLRAAGARLVRMEGGFDDPGHDTSGCMTMWAHPSKGQRVTAVAANPYMPNLIWPIHLTGGLDGPLFPPRLSREELNSPPNATHPNKGWLCVQQKLPAGAAASVHMGLAWFFPNHRTIRGTRVGHMYENGFDSSVAVARHLVRGRAALLAASRRLPDGLMASSLPAKLKLSLLDQLSTLTKSTHFAKSGRFGLQEGHGCCAFNTMDVDHYSSYALSALLPQLRETVLDIHTALAHPETGKIHHGLPATIEEIPAGGEEGYNRWDCCCQYVLQVYRDTKWAGNTAALRRYWPTVKRAMDVIIALDFYEIGLPYIEGGITYDHWRMKGVVGYMAGLYLAALRAVEDMADFLGEADTAERMRGLFARGRAAFEKHLWNGRQYLLYYSRRPKEEGPAGYAHDGEEGHLHAQRPPACCVRPGAYVEIADTGVMTDLLNGNASAQVLGLGAFLDAGRVRRQLRLTLERNLQRENLAVINGSYPDGHFLDGWPFMQWQTPWTGTEYFLALQLYAAGLVKEGDEVVDLVFDRQTREGMRFDHTECNNHYARPLCIWGAYAARLGLDVDGWRGGLTLRPAGGRYDGLLVTAQMNASLVYSEARQATHVTLNALDGRMTLRTFTVGARRATRVTVRLDGRAVPATVTREGETARVAFARPLVLKAGGRLSVAVV